MRPLLLLLLLASPALAEEAPPPKRTCTVYVVVQHEAETSLQADLAEQKVVAREDSQTEIEIHAWQTSPELTEAAARAACFQKAEATCAKSQAKPGPCRFEIHVGDARGWEAATSVRAPPKVKKARKKKRKKAKRRRKARGNAK